MAVSKRTRFEVLRRDNYTCRYCGASAPDVELTVDHVVPVALGGTDNPDNLVTACRDCNAGKASTSPDAALVQQVGEDDMRWAAAIKRAAEAMIADHHANLRKHQWFLDEWSRRWDEDLNHLPEGWEKSLDHWIGAGLPEEIVVEALHIALRNRSVPHDSVFAYMGGICRNRIEKLHETARDYLGEEDPDGT